MVDYPEREHFSGGPIRLLSEDIVDALREAVIVVDSNSPLFPVILANAAARECIGVSPTNDSAIDVSLRELLGPEADDVISDAQHSARSGDATFSRYLTWRIPAGEIRIPTEVTLLDSERGAEHPSVLLKFMGPKRDSLGDVHGFSAIEQKSLGLVILDRDLCLTFANELAARMAGISAHGLIGIDARTISPTSALPPEALTRALDGNAVHEGAIAITNPGLPTRWFEIDIHPLADLSVVAGLALLIKESPRTLPISDSRSFAPSPVEGSASLRDLILVATQDATLQFVSQSVSGSLGFEPRELISRSLFSLAHPVDVGDLESDYAQLCSGSIASFSRTLRLRQRSGHYRWLELTFAPALDNPRIRGVVTYAREVSEQRWVGARLAQREEVIGLISDAVNGVIFEWDLTRGIVYRSRAVRDLLQMDPADLEKAGAWTALVHPQDRGAYERQVVAALESGRGWTATYRIRTAHGQYLSVLERGLIQRNAHGFPIRVIGCAVDVSEIKRLSDLLAEAQRIAQICGWEYRYGTSDLLCTEEVFRILETTPAQFDVSLQSLLQRCSLPTQQRLTDLIASADSADGRFDLEFEITTLKQRRCWVRLVGLIEKVDGRHVRAFGSFQDIQEQKLAQIALNNLTDWLKLSMGMADLHAWRWHSATDTLEFAIVDGQTVNTPHVFPGMRKLMSRVHPKDRSQVRRAIANAFERHTDVNREFRLKARDGGYRIYSTIARPLFDAADRPLGLVGVTQDVTSTHESQAQLRRSEELLRTTTANTADTLILIDTHLMIRFINRDFANLKIANLIDRDVAVILPPRQRGNLLSRLRRVLSSGQTDTFDFESAVPGGPTRYFESRAVLVREAVIGAGISITVRDITERKRMEREILDVSNRERQAIGRDLHDGLGQELTGIALLLRGLATRIEANLPESRREDSRREVEEIVALVNRSIDTARALARGLLPVDADTGGLTAALRALTQRAQDIYGFDVKLKIRVGNERFLSEAIANHLYRITQEALTNAARHAKASSVEIHLRVTARKFLLRIVDDGVGIPEPLSHGYGMGLKIMRYRASVINAMMEIAGHYPRGTVVCVTGKLEHSLSQLESADAQRSE